jgi:hypothetical protein
MHRTGLGADYILQKKINELVCRAIEVIKNETGKNSTE